jgi:DNA-3-methyladenine glycosylase
MDQKYLQLNEDKIKPLKPEFFYRDPLDVAYDLIGKLLIKTGQNPLIVRLVEVEAYRGKKDPASHAYKGVTKRNKIMFQEPGHLYVYFNYGMYWLANVVCHKEKNEAGAVLLRAAIPLIGIEQMRQARRKHNPKVTIKSLTNGPGKLCQALGIDKSHYGEFLAVKKGYENKFLLASDCTKPKDVIQTGRIGIKKASDLPWRFCVKDCEWVS